MKKLFLFFVFLFVSAALSASLAACSGQVPQVKVTSEATVTSLPPTETPIPTPTLHPQFAALQDQIAASGERFTLNAADGKIYDGANEVKGLLVSPARVVTLTVDGEQVEIDPSIMNFDDEKGLSIEGFEDADGDGDYEPAETGPSPEQITAMDQFNADANGVLTIDMSDTTLDKYPILSKAGEGAPVEGMKFLENGKIEITFWSDGLQRDFTQQIDPSFIDFGISAGVPVNVENIVKALRLDGNGQLERRYYTDKEAETHKPIRTQREVLQMIVENHSEAVGARVDTKEHGAEIRENFTIRGTNGFWYYQDGDLYEKMVGNAFGRIKVMMWNEETQNYDEIDTSLWNVTGIGADPNYVAVTWIGEDGEPIFEIAGVGPGADKPRSWGFE